MSYCTAVPLRVGRISAERSGKALHSAFLLLDHPVIGNLPRMQQRVRGVYWPNYAEDAQQGGLPAVNWHFNYLPHYPVHAGDMLVLFTSGKVLRTDHPYKGYLVQVMQIRRVTLNPGDNPRYPRHNYERRIVAEPKMNVLFPEPVEFDFWLRPTTSDRELPIGNIRQAPFDLDPQACCILSRHLKNLSNAQAQSSASSCTEAGEGSA